MSNGNDEIKEKVPAKAYIRDEDFDDEVIDFSFVDYEPETFHPVSTFLLTVMIMLKNIDGGEDEGNVNVDEHDDH
ncbi:hypothetical protein L1887_11089 [Cichorium endivia]|nr:hypothetical protein L1887_11089 [Cichorium endivia]